MQHQKKVGFIGLGDMGRGMAKNLTQKGFEVAIFDIREEPMKELAALGAMAANSPKEVAEVSDVVITMVRDIPQTEEVIFGENGVWQGIKNGSTIIISSTIEPQYCQKVEEIVSGRGVHVLDAPCAGGRGGAEAGTMSFMVGGEKAIFDECYPIFEAMGKSIYYSGGIGMGETMKAVNQLAYFVNMASASEAILLGLKAGLELERLLEVIKASTGGSWVIEHWDYLVTIRKEYQQKRQGSTLDLVYKDIGTVLKVAKDLDEFVPLAGLVSQMDVSRWFPDNPPSP